MTQRCVSCPGALPTADRSDRERVVYVREDELLQELASTLGQVTGRRPTPEEVPALLRENETMTVCGPTVRALRPARAHDEGPSPMG